MPLGIWNAREEVGLEAGLGKRWYWLGKQSREGMGNGKIGNGWERRVLKRLGLEETGKGEVRRSRAEWGHAWGEEADESTPITTWSGAQDSRVSPFLCRPQICEAHQKSVSHSFYSWSPQNTTIPAEDSYSVSSSAKGLGGAPNVFNLGEGPWEYMRPQDEISIFSDALLKT